MNLKYKIIASHFKGNIYKINNNNNKKINPETPKWLKV